MATAGAHAQPSTNGNGSQPANGSPKPETKAVVLTPIQRFRELLSKWQGQIATALPTHVDVERFLRVVLTTVQQNPKLFECTRESLLGRLMQCAQLGLEPDGLLGHAYLVPYKISRKTGRKDGRGKDIWEERLECQLIVGYKGLIKLARQSGEVEDVNARVVYAKDTFEYEYGLEERLKHKPYMIQDPEDERDTAGPAGPAVYVYCIFRLNNGGHHFEVMSVQQIERIRSKSKSGDSPAWEDHWDEMAKKTVIRRTAKLSPASIEDRVGKAIALDERAEAGLPQDVDGSGAFLLDDPDKPTIEAPPDPEVIELSSLKQRKDIVTLAGQAKVAVADVLKWFKDRQAVDELTRQQADEAIAKLQAVIADEKGPIS